MAHLKDDSTYVPLLSEKHTGIPKRLLEKAKEAKAHVLSVRTKVQGTKQRTSVYPPGLEEGVFDKAVKEIREQLGADQVVLNDQPLEDGWYMERERITRCHVLFSQLTNSAQIRIPMT
ncbi:hypothetical protein GGR55DRAFT_288411 [Xylaria sp. FL0064]|nr:hypothetical protein GGR55DRAFT_288411 [Xylaria sp. FL0064]